LSICAEGVLLWAGLTSQTCEDYFLMNPKRPLQPSESHCAHDQNEASYVLLKKSQRAKRRCFLGKVSLYLRWPWYTYLAQEAAQPGAPYAGKSEAVALLSGDTLISPASGSDVLPGRTL